jgi:hypothetical protein
MPSIDDPKSVFAQATSGPFRPGDGRGAGETMRRATGWLARARLGEETARHVELGRHVKILVVFPEIGEEGDALRVSQKPGRFIIAGIGPVIESGDAQDDSESATVGTHRAARWRRGARR